MKAWLLIWDQTERGERKREIVAVLSWRCSKSHVREHAELLFVARAWSVREKMDLARKKREPPPCLGLDDPREGAPISFGTNPFLNAYLVDDLTVESDTSTGFDKAVTWKTRSGGSSRLELRAS